MLHAWNIQGFCASRPHTDRVRLGIPLRGIARTWDASLSLVVSVGGMARLLAKEVDVDVLFEVQDSVSDTAAQEQWLLASPTNGSLRVVRIKPFQDGFAWRLRPDPSSDA
jgi:hypothetical protein